MKTFARKLLEASIAVLPITVLVIVLNFAMGAMPALNLAAFLIGCICLNAGEA